MACESIVAEITILTADRDALYEELQASVGMGKARIVSEIRELNNRIFLKRRELEICKIQNPDPFPTLITDLVGSATMTIRDIPGASDMTFSSGFIASVTFDPQRRYVRINSVEPIRTAPYMIPSGTNITTVTLRNPTQGSYDKSARHINITLPLFFDQSFDIILYEEDSSIDYSLSTSGNINGSEGRPIDQNGNLVLVGSGRFTGGYLNDKDSELTITAQLANMP